MGFYSHRWEGGPRHFIKYICPPTGPTFSIDSNQLWLAKAISLGQSHTVMQPSIQEPRKLFPVNSQGGRAPDPSDLHPGVECGALNLTQVATRLWNFSWSFSVGQSAARNVPLTCANSPVAADVASICTYRRLGTPPQAISRRLVLQGQELYPHLALQGYT